MVFIYYNTTAKTVTVKEGIQDVYSIPAGSYAIVEENSAKDNTPVVTAVVIKGAASYVDSNTLIYVSNNAVTGRVTLDNKTTGHPGHRTSVRGLCGRREADHHHQQHCGRQQLLQLLRL